MKIKIDKDATAFVLKRLREQGVPVRSERNIGEKYLTIIFDEEYEPDLPAIKLMAKEALIEYRTQGVETYDPLNLRDVTPAQIETYINNNITDLPSAKVYLKRLSSLVLYLYKRVSDVE